MMIFISVLLLIGLIVYNVVSYMHNKDIERKTRSNPGRYLNYSEEEKFDKMSDEEKEDVIARIIESKQFIKIPKFAQVIWVVTIFGTFSAGIFDNVMYYAKPGYQYYARTITGQEKHITQVGWFTYWFGDVTSWKNAMSIQTSELETELENSDVEQNSVSANIGPQSVTFLDQVDGKLYATVRFKTPVDDKQFFNMVHEYRTPENLMRTALIPAFRETASITAQLMTAEEFFSGGRSVFASEFENQMFNGVYLIERKEKVVDVARSQPASAKANKGNKQDRSLDEKKTITVVVKKIDSESGQPLRNPQKFLSYGISVVEARVMDMKPNAKFIQRMQQKQEASAARAVAKEQRLQEEEKRLLAEAAGARMVAEKQAEEKQRQIVATTKAETEKALAIIDATKNLEQAKIEKQAAAEQLERDRIKAKSVKVLADAEAYAKHAVIKANGALELKLAAYKYAVDRMATAIEKRQVPQSLIMMGGAGKGSDLAGSSSSINDLLQVIAASSAKQLNLDLTTTRGNIEGK